MAPANLPPTLVPPVGATLKIHDHATGAQVYTCTAMTGGAGGGGGAGGAGGATTSYSWVLKQPDAMLFDQSGTQVGTHGIGPNWTSTDGSIVNGVKVWQENSPLSDAIPWLLLRAATNGGTQGVFTDVTYVIRANTMLGKAPATGCDSTTVNTDKRVDYSADYYFYSGGGQMAWMTRPANVPSGIAVPSGATFAIHDHAIGAQVYTCTASSAGGAGGGGGAGGAGGSGTSYSWVLKQPDAQLFDSSFTQVGTHGAGPNWTSTIDGSVVNGLKTASANSPEGATVSIPWLLLMATSNTGTGVFTPITYVQRLATHGGVAPTSGCDSTAVNTDTRAPYSADYFFFTGGNTTPDGGTTTDGGTD
jgi:hypothetical protein